jgi:hypothetical protein
MQTLEEERAMSAEAAIVIRNPAAASQAQAETFDRAYWVAHCEGYGVESKRGRLGFVDEVRENGDRTTIAVRAGLLGRRLLVYSVADIAFIVPRAQKIFLYSSAQPVESCVGRGRSSSR